MAEGEGTAEGIIRVIRVYNAGMAPKSANQTNAAEQVSSGKTFPEVVPFEHRLRSDLRYGMGEASIYFEGSGAVQKTLQKITRKLDELGIPYAVAGGMALFGHGFERFTVDVDILVTEEGLREIHEQLEGLGYIPPFRKSKQLRDVEYGVKIDFLVAGQFPGDGKPKPVSFPDPKSVAVEIAGIKYLSLPTLIDLKLASGISSPGRVKDLGDVQELIKALKLPREFSEGLNEYVRGKFIELWEGSKSLPGDPHE
jgi:hypothetical protein